METLIFFLYTMDMILNISGRTDIVAFYTPWLMKRFEEGYFLVRNPFYEKSVSRIEMENVDAIVFCSKNPIPILPYLNQIDKPIQFQITCTPYHKDIEPGVPDKKQIIEAIKIISERIGKENTVLRFDPILLNEKYTVDYHIRAFERICSLLDGYIERIIVSFVDLYKNVQNHADELNLKMPDDDDFKTIGRAFSQIAKSHHMKVQSCYEEHDFTKYGWSKEVCVSRKAAFELTGKTNFKIWKARDCGCVEMVDVGVYNSCNHLCKYCYANFDEKKIQLNRADHDPNSPFLIGHSNPDDIIKRRY